MADMRRPVSREQFVARFRGLFPNWTVEVSRTELVAVWPTAQSSWEQMSADTKKLRELSQQFKVAVVSRMANGQFVVSVDLTGLK